MRNKEFISCVLLVLLGLALSSAKCVSSLADNAGYRAVCVGLAKDPDLFAHFKRSGVYTLLHEYTTCAEGHLYASYTLEHYPDLLRFVEMFRKNDLLGDPITHTYPFFGQMSPSTVRYIKLAGDIAHHLGSLDGKRVVEIGAGYGGLCTVLSSLHKWKNYTIVDTEENLAIARLYLNQLGIKDVTFAPFDKIPKDAEIFLSDHGFGQCHRTLQERCLRSMVKAGSSGYMICSSYPRHFRIRPLSQQELVKKISREKLHCELVVEEPEVSKDNFILTWK